MMLKWNFLSQQIILCLLIDVCYVERVSEWTILISYCGVLGLAKRGCTIHLFRQSTIEVNDEAGNGMEDLQRHTEYFAVILKSS